MHGETNLDSIDDSDKAFSRAIADFESELKEVESMVDSLKAKEKTDILVTSLDKLTRGRYFGKKVRVIGEHWSPEIYRNSDPEKVPLNCIDGFTTGLSSGFTIIDTWQTLEGEENSSPESQYRGELLREKLQAYGRYAVCHLVSVGSLGRTTQASEIQQKTIYSAVAPARHTLMTECDEWDEKTNVIIANTSLEILKRLPQSFADNLSHIEAKTKTDEEPMLSLLEVRPDCLKILNQVNDYTRFMLTEYLNSVIGERLRAQPYLIPLKDYYDFIDADVAVNEIEYAVEHRKKIMIVQIICDVDYDSIQEQPLGFSKPVFDLKFTVPFEHEDVKGLFYIPISYFANKKIR